MAAKETWDKLKFFRPDSTIDNWGDHELISDNHILRLDDFRRWIGVPIYVTRGVAETGHSDGSQHYPKFDEAGNLVGGATATDIVVPNYPRSVFDLILDATRFGFTGIGYYPHWRWNGDTVGGLHLDSRPLKWDADETINYAHSRWIGTLVDGKMNYESMTYERLKILGG